MEEQCCNVCKIVNSMSISKAAHFIFISNIVLLTVKFTLFSIITTMSLLTANVITLALRTFLACYADVLSGGSVYALSKYCILLQNNQIRITFVQLERVKEKSYEALLISNHQQLCTSRLSTFINNRTIGKKYYRYYKDTFTQYSTAFLFLLTLAFRKFQLPIFTQLWSSQLAANKANLTRDRPAGGRQLGTAISWLSVLGLG